MATTDPIVSSLIQTIAENNDHTYADTARIVEALGLNTADLIELANLNAELIGCNTSTNTADKLCGHHAWLVWFADALTVTAVTNADPMHFEQVPDAKHAMWAVRGLCHVAGAGASDVVKVVLDDDGDLDVQAVADEWIGDGDCAPEPDEDGTVQTAAYAVAVEDYHGVESVVICATDPDEPECADGTTAHEWREQGRYSDGAGVQVVEKCPQCGQRKVTRTAVELCGTRRFYSSVAYGRSA